MRGELARRVEPLPAQPAHELVEIHISLSPDRRQRATIVTRTLEVAAEEFLAAARQLVDVAEINEQIAELDTRRAELLDDALAHLAVVHQLHAGGDELVGYWRQADQDQVPQGVLESTRELLESTRAHASSS